MTDIDSMWRELSNAFEPPDDERRKELQWGVAGIPRRVRDVIQSSLNDTVALDRTKKWTKARSQDPSIWCLVLSAGKGSGKSVAAGWAMTQIGARCVDSVNKLGHGKYIPAWWPASKFARLSGYDGTFDQICAHNGIVILDDLGTEFLDSKGWFLQAIDAFVDSRYCEYRPTIITTNLNAKSFKDRYSERVIDRLREGGSFFEFPGGSLRCQK